MEGLGQSSEAWARHLSELVHHLEDVARAQGRDLDIPEPLFFADLLGILRNLEVAPAEFFRATDLGDQLGCSLPGGPGCLGS